jgi:hypothetical protein
MTKVQYLRISTLNANYTPIIHIYTSHNFKSHLQMSTSQTEANPQVEWFREMKAAFLHRARAASVIGGFVQDVRRMDEELVRTHCFYHISF